MTGTSFGGASTGSDYATVAYDASTGAVTWQRRSADAWDDEARAIAATADGHEVVATGTHAGGATGDDFLTVAYNPSTGAKLWSKTLNDSADGDDTAAALAITPDSATMLVTGTTPKPSAGTALTTVAYNAATGAHAWSRLYGTGTATGLAVSPDSSDVFALGTTGDSPAVCEVVALSAGDGTQIWQKRLPDDGFRQDCSAGEIAVRADGGTLVIGGTESFGDTDFVETTLDVATGTIPGRSSTRWVHAGMDTSSALAVSPNSSRLYLTGETQTTSTVNEFGTAAFFG